MLNVMNKQPGPYSS